MQCIIESLSVEYYERISCINYYHEGILVRPDRPVELIMIGFSRLSMGAVTDHEFVNGDILLFDIKVDGYPYDKLMGEIMCQTRFGYMYRLDIKFLGMPNTLFEKIKVLNE